MTSITEFILARVAEDEERAQFVARQNEGNNWTPHEPWRLSWHDEYDLLCIEPSRALTECEAKRTILSEHAVTTENAWPGEYACSACLTDRDGYSDNWDPDPYPCRTVRALAAIWANHPDYREEWR